MVAALAWCLAVRAVVEARRDAILSFDVAVARRAFPSIKLVPVEESDRDWTRRVVSSALARYPIASLITQLDRVYVVNDISYKGTQ